MSDEDFVRLELFNLEDIGIGDLES
jgi:hypothetical protein